MGHASKDESADIVPGDPLQHAHATTNRDEYPIQQAGPLCHTCGRRKPSEMGTAAWQRLSLRSTQVLHSVRSSQGSNFIPLPLGPAPMIARRPPQIHWRTRSCRPVCQHRVTPTRKGEHRYAPQQLWPLVRETRGQVAEEHQAEFKLTPGRQPEALLVLQQIFHGHRLLSGAGQAWRRA